MVNGFFSGAAGGATVAIVIKAIDKYSNEFNKATTSMQKFKKVAVSVSLAATAAFTAFTVAATKAGLAAIPIEQSFKKLAKGSDKFLTQLHTATLGTVSDFELMSNANKALLLGLNQDALPDLFRNAAIVGRAAGRTTTEAIQDITLGIGRQSRLILDNLGIVLKAGDVYEQFAQSIGKTSSELTESEKKLAFTQAAMDALQQSADNLGGIIPEDTITNIQQLTAAMNNFKVAFGEAFVKTLGKSLKTSEKDFSNFGKTVGKVLGSLIISATMGVKILVTAGVGIVGAITDGIINVIKPLEFFINKTIDLINRVIDGINKFRRLAGLDEIRNIEKVDLTSGLQSFRDRVAKQAAERVKEINEMAKGLKDTWFEVGKEAEQSIDGTNKKLTKQEELVKKLAGLKLIPQTGDIFNPKAFITSAQRGSSFNGVQISGSGRFGEFQSQQATRIAQRGGGVTINIENVNGLDPEEISRALSRELSGKTSL